MKLWQLKEKHYADVKGALRKDGCLDSKEQIRAWHGKQTLKALNSSGHDHVKFERCKCHKGLADSIGRNKLNH